MKVIFLDIDGVLNVYGSPYCGKRDEFGDCFHKHFEENLKCGLTKKCAEKAIQILNRNI